MAIFKSKNARTAALAAALLVPTSVVVLYAPTLYAMFCAATGLGGAVQRAEKPLDRPGVADGKTVTVYFDSNVAPGLPWEFRPEQRSVEVTLGEPAKVYYRAKNNADEPVVARATFNVAPYGAAPYFFKIECFCFTEERLEAGASARMPLVLYLDEQIMKDPDARRIDEVTLSYTFYRQEELSREEAQAARDMAAESKTLDAKLEQSETATFANDAPRER